MQVIYWLYLTLIILTKVQHWDRMNHGYKPICWRDESKLDVQIGQDESKLKAYIEIITVDELFGPPSMKTIALRSIRDIVDRSKCHLCCVIYLCLPKELEKELLQIIPTDFWVRIPSFF